jgi:hypothetical protein
MIIGKRINPFFFKMKIESVSADVSPFFNGQTKRKKHIKVHHQKILKH